MLRVALIGCGAIGVAVLELLQADADLRVTALVASATSVGRAASVAQRLAPAASVVTAVPVDDVDLVVEAAGHSAIEQHVLPALQRGTPCIVASVGALAGEGMPARLEAAARQGATQVQLVSGGIGAIDALAAARIGGLDFVRYTGRKAPHAWNGTPAEQAFELDALVQSTVIFEGSAREAATLYPKNANVAATVSLAGIGLDLTQVRLIADPDARENIHTIDARGSFGSLALTLHNKPLASNPKSSALTVYSLVRAVRQRAAALVI